MIGTSIKIKICTKCRKEWPRTIEFFAACKTTKDKLQSWCRGCTREYGRCRNKKYRQTEEGKERHRQDSALYRQRHPERVREQRKRNHQKFRCVHLQKMKEYNNTAAGYLRHVYGDIKRRIANPMGRNKCYKDIKNKFKSSDEFVNYVISVLKINPLGKQIHRVDSGHYEPGGIEFLTPEAHMLKHRKVRAI